MATAIMATNMRVENKQEIMLLLHLFPVQVFLVFAAVFNVNPIIKTHIK